MLRIYPVILELIRELRPLVVKIGRLDPDLAKQLRRSKMSMALTVSEGTGSRGGRRRLRYEDALGSAREALTTLEAAGAAGYIGSVEPAIRSRFDHIIGTLVNLVR